MNWVAWKMLTGDRAKYLGTVFGVAFGVLLSLAGGIALVFAAARRKGKRLTIEQLRRLLIETARPMSPPGRPKGKSRSTRGWDPRYGFGRIDIAAAIRRLDSP